MAYALELMLALSAVELAGLHSQLLSKHVYVADRQQYGVEDYWKRSLVGDCEDFALYAYFELSSRGYKPEFWLVRAETGEMHATIAVAGFVFDNLKMQKLKSSSYKFIAKVDETALRRYWE